LHTHAIIIATGQKGQEMTEQMFALRIGTTFANEVADRQLNQYGTAFAKIAERYEQGQRKPYTMHFTAEDIELIKSECDWVNSRDCNWESYLKTAYRGMLRQIAKVTA
jgi:hypothetical protein